MMMLLMMLMMMLIMLMIDNDIVVVDDNVDDDDDDWWCRRAPVSTEQLITAVPLTEWLIFIMLDLEERLCWGSVWLVQGKFI